MYFPCTRDACNLAVQNMSTSLLVLRTHGIVFQDHVINYHPQPKLSTKEPLNNTHLPYKHLQSPPFPIHVTHITDLPKESASSPIYQFMNVGFLSRFLIFFFVFQSSGFLYYTVPGILFYECRVFLEKFVRFFFVKDFFWSMHIHGYMLSHSCNYM